MRAFKWNEDENDAPENLFGYKHCAMKDMKPMTQNDFNYYIKPNQTLFNETCFGLKCKHGVAGKNWPVKAIIGNKFQAYWCQFTSSGYCKTFFYVDCEDERLNKEISINRNRSSGRLERRRQKIVGMNIVGWNTYNDIYIYWYKTQLSVFMHCKNALVLLL